MNKKYKVFLIMFLIIIFKTHGLNEQWVLNNQFMQFVRPGNITFQNFPYNIIESIRFTDINAFSGNSQIKRASIRMMDENDITRTYECNYLDMGDIILLQIFKENETIDLILNIVQFTNNNIWYSFSVSIDIENGFVRGINENDNQYINYIGTIRRN